MRRVALTLIPLLSPSHATATAVEHLHSPYSSHADGRQHPQGRIRSVTAALTSGGSLTEQ